MIFRLLKSCGVALALIVAVGPFAQAEDAAPRDMSKVKIGVTVYAITNSWHKQMISSLEGAADTAKKDGLLSDIRILNANGDAQAQASQISNFILQKVDAIIVNAASPTALNGVIADACAAGIVVVTYDSIATAPCATKVAYDWQQHGRTQAEYFAKRFGGKANLLEIRGLPGTDVDDNAHKGVVDALKDYPNVNLTSVRGDWTPSVALKNVASILPSLPNIDGVITQGETGNATYQAFKNAGRKAPVIVMAAKEDELKLWKSLDQSGGYETFSISTSPSIGAVALWATEAALQGHKMPDIMYIPFLQITKDNVDAWIKVTPDNAIAMPVYSRDWTDKAIAAALAGQPSPPNPGPGG
jgi:ribose transport system substrate-binding protein